MEIYLSLGSNLNDRGENLKEAMILLERWGIKILRSSSIYETEPIVFKEQPWFYNMVVKCETSLTPEEVLKAIDAIEKALKRVRDPEQRSGPRTIDIDILLCGDLSLNVPGLEIPHPRMHQRLFVLEPLVEIAPNVNHPILKKSASELLKDCGDKAIVSKL